MRAEYRETASAVVSGERVDRVDPRVSLSIAHLPRIGLPTETAADGRHAWTRGDNFTFRLLNPGRFFLGLLPAAPISVGTITRSSDFARPQHWGSSGEIPPIGRRTFSSSVAGSEGCPGDLPTAKFEAIGASAAEGFPIGGGTRLKCGLDRHRYQSCAAKENAHGGRIHARTACCNRASSEGHGSRHQCVRSATWTGVRRPSPTGCREARKAGENWSATIPSCRPDRILSRVRVRRRAAFLRCPTRTVG